MARRPRRDPPIILHVSYAVNNENAKRALDIFAEGLRRALVEEGKQRQ